MEAVLKCWANLMLCLDIQMANIISLYLMLLRSCQPAAAMKNSLNQKLPHGSSDERESP